MKEELDALHKTGTWDLVDLPSGKSVIGCKWVYKIKTRSDDTVDCYKARLVARGFTQEYGIDYEDIFCSYGSTFLCQDSYCHFYGSQMATLLDGCQKCFS